MEPKKTPLIALFAILLTLSFSSHARQAVGIDYLHGSDDIDGVRLTYRPYSTNLTTGWFGDLQLYWEASAILWEYGEDNNHTSNFAIALSPVFVKHIATIGQSYPVYLEAGIGASLVHDRQFAGKNIGSHYQFEDRIGFLFSLDPEDNKQLAVRYMHYSNGGIDTHNPGLDFLNVSYVQHF